MWGGNIVPWVGGIGTACDGRNKYRTVPQQEFLTLILKWNSGRPLIFRNGKALEANRSSKTGPEVLFHLRRRNSVVGSLGPGETWHNCGQVEMVHLRKHWVLAFVVEVSEHACSFQVGCNVLHTLCFSACLHQVIQRPLIHRKEP